MKNKSYFKLSLIACLKTNPILVAAEVTRLHYLGFPDRRAEKVRASLRRLLLFKHALIAASIFGFVSVTQAQSDAQIEVRTGITPGNMPPIWVSFSGFTGEAEEVLRFDLCVQGFNFTNAEAAQYLLTGSNNGNVQGQLTDRIHKKAISRQELHRGPLRRQAHALADDVVEAITGKKGIGQTKIAFKTEISGKRNLHRRF